MVGSVAFLGNIKAQAIKSSANDTRMSDLTMDLNKKIFVIAHRGASAYYPENTMAAFKAAVSMEADMIELDVLLSKDKVPVVFHDEKLDKKSNGKGLVSNYNLEELKEFDAGSWFSREFENEKIPTLKEVLEYTKNKILVNIEIKTEAVLETEVNGIEQLVLEIVEELEIEDQVIISSFDYRVIRRVNRFSETIKTALLYEKSQSSGKSPSMLYEEFNFNAFNCSKNQLSEKWKSELKKFEIPYFVYTVNDKSEMMSLINGGAKGIFSDKPDLLKEVYEQSKSKN